MRFQSTRTRRKKGYYSIFQIDHLAMVLAGLTLHLHLDSYLESDRDEPADWQRDGARWLRYARDRETGLREHQHRRAVALLCQHVSNRYFPHTQSDMRTRRIKSGTFSDRWIVVHSHHWDWHDHARQWDPMSAERFYRLTRNKLLHAYEGLAIAQESCDPIANWYPLTQFISLHERSKLKGDALRAETLRAAAHMLRFLHKDLYNEDLPHPNEVTGTVVNHFPELEIRHDVRRYLEFVSNRFGVNPQPKLSLFVEGRSEEVAVMQIFGEYFGAHPGTYGIEIIVLGGVDAATGSKEDRFRAIMRLVDYLHHHQTFAFLVLDDERYARRLKAAAERMSSIHTDQRFVTRPEYVRVWKNSFEFDNFSCTEIATALNELAHGGATFTMKEVATARDGDNSGAALKELYLQRTGDTLDKPELSKILARNMFSPSARRNVEHRPIVRILRRVAVLAARNPLPTTQRTSDANQASKFLGTKRQPRSQ